MVTCPLPPQGLTTTATADLQHLLKRVQGGEQKWGTLWWGETSRTGLQIDIFRGCFYEPNSWVSLYLEGAKILHDDNCSLRLAELHETSKNLLEKYVLDCMYSPFIKIICILTFPPASLELFLRAIWSVVSQSSFCSNKTYFTILRLCIFSKST